MSGILSVLSEATGILHIKIKKTIMTRPNNLAAVGFIWSSGLVLNLYTIFDCIRQFVLPLVLSSQCSNWNCKQWHIILLYIVADVALFQTSYYSDLSGLQMSLPRDAWTIIKGSWFRKNAEKGVILLCASLGFFINLCFHVANYSWS